MEKSLDLSVVIVSYNTRELTLGCIRSVIEKTKGVGYEIVVVDNGSKDGSIEELKNQRNKELKRLKILENRKNLGFAAANNQGWRASSGKYILFLNSDTEIKDNVLGEMVEWLEGRPNVGAATCKLKSKDGSLQPTGGYFPTLLSVFSWMTIQDFPLVDKFIKPFHPLHIRSFFSRGEEFYETAKELDWVTGAFLLTRKDILERLGGWDETYFMYVEEVDLCFRIKDLNYKVWYLPRWNIIHYGGASSKVSEYPLLAEYKSIKKFYKKFYSTWQLPILRLLLKIGALGRVVLFTILKGKEAGNVYLKAFREV